MPPLQDERRLRVPLGPKIGLLSGLVLAALLALDGWVGITEDLDQRMALRRQQQEGLARATAELLDPELVASWQGSADMQTPGYRRTVAALRRVRRAGGVRWVGLYGRQGERFHYILDSEDEDPNPIGFPFFDPSEAMEQAFEGQLTFQQDTEDEWGRWDSAFAPLRLGGEVVAVVCVDVDADWRAALTRRHVGALLGRLAASCGALLLISIAIGRALNRPLTRLARAAAAVQGGDLEHEVRIRTRDELELLGGAFNEMIRGLKERDRMREAFGRYVSPGLARRVLEDPDALKPGGRLAPVTILMSDLRGFTDLSAARSPEQMVALLNAYLQRMSEVIDAHGGAINEFIGDAILALFGATEPGPDDALRAVRCAAAMQQALEGFNAKAGEAPLVMGIGVHTGPVVIGNIGSEQHVKWGVVGDAVNMTARVESMTVGGEVLLSEDTWRAVREQVRARGPIEAKVKGRAEPLRVYALQEIGALQVPAERAAQPLQPVDWAATLWRMRGKQIDEEAHSAQVIGLARRRLGLRTPLALEPHAELRLRVEAPEGALEGLYAKVVEVDAAGLVTLAIRSAPALTLRRLDTLVSEFDPFEE
ncbi:MAG: adenylate/guanylate cyclase domain-containing protein [Alphaproteobacteria bacterium]|nr:adenylate/guanylate cyclase domain-containing protein [Alphaproteobacteria bacterium]